MLTRRKVLEGTLSTCACWALPGMAQGDAASPLRPRVSFLLSTKMPTWLVKSLDDARRIFTEQLERCQVEYFDFYLLHSISRKEDFERVYVENGVLDYLIEQKTGCSYCVPCPYGVRIPEIFAWYNEWAQSGRLPEDGGANDSQDLRRRFLASYRNKFGLRERADRCIGCQKCLVPCPQWTFKIPEEMTKITELVSHVEKVYVAKGGTFR